MEPTELSERMFEFAVRIVSATNSFPRTVAGRNVGDQLIRSGTSGPANYEEACAAQSRADFIHKMQIVLKELRETRFWLRLAKECGLAPGELVTPILKESGELCNIIGKSVLTAKQRTLST